MPRAIELTEAEVNELIRLVRDRAGDMSQEIHHTIMSSFHDHLRDRKEVLLSILQKLQDARPIDKQAKPDEGPRPLT